ncbi:MAG: cytidine deaminase [Sphingobium sp.]|nr:cytidine deaminase [Sphingobium sp.]
MSDRTADERELADAARAAMGHAYAPYSRFAVGAALRLADGSIVTGSNFENASYGLSLCAETVAVAAANAQGRLHDIVAIAVAGAPMDGPRDAVVTPCGRCRQVLNEAQDVAGREIPILCVAADGSAIVRHKLADLLPHAFGPANLG